MITYEGSERGKQKIALEPHMDNISPLPLTRSFRNFVQQCGCS